MAKHSMDDVLLAEYESELAQDEMLRKTVEGLNMMISTYDDLFDTSGLYDGLPSEEEM